MIQPLPSLSALTLSTTQTQYHPVFVDTINATENNGTSLIASPGTLDDLIVVIDTDPGGTANRAFTLRINGVDQTLTCQINAGGSLTARMTGNPISVTAGQRLSIKCVPTNTPAACSVQFYLKFTPTSGFKSIYGGLWSLSQLSGTRFTFPLRISNTDSTTSTTVNVVLQNPLVGNITAMYAHWTALPGVGVGGTLNLLKNNIVQDGTAGSVNTTLSMVNIQDNNVSFTLPMSATDDFTLQVVMNAAGAFSQILQIGIEVTATNDNESILACSSGSLTSAIANTFFGPAKCQNAWSTTEGFATQTFCGTTPFTLSAPRIKLANAPGVGKSYQFVMRKGGAGTSPSGTISDANTSVTGTGSVSYVDTNTLGWQAIPTGTPTVSTLASLALLMTASGGGNPNTQTDWPNPRVKKPMGSGYLFNYMQDLTNFPDGKSSFFLPLPRKSPTPSTWVQSRPFFYTEPSGLPNRLRDFPNPIAKKRGSVGYEFYYISEAPASGPLPNGQNSYINPLPRRRPGQKYEFYYTQESIPFPPVGIQFTTNPTVRVRAQNVGFVKSPNPTVTFAQLPAGRQSFVNPLLKKLIALTLINPSLQLTQQPFRQTEWPNPRVVKFVLTHIQSKPFYYFEDTMPPFRQTDWRNPAPRTGHLITLSSTLPATEINPFSIADLSLPVLKKRLAESWIINLLQSTLNPGAGATLPPGNLSFPNPALARAKRQDWISFQIIQDDIPGPGSIFFPNPIIKARSAFGFETERPFYYVDPASPIKQSDWPNPSYGKKQTLFWTENGLLDVLSPMPPLSQLDWPNPLRGRANRVDLVNDITRLITGNIPFGFTEWRVPLKGVLRQDWNYNPVLPLNTVDPIKPFSQLVWLPFPKFGKDKFNYDILNFVYVQTIIPSITGREICLLAAITTYDLLGELEVFNLPADITDYDLEAGGSDCP